MQFSKTGEKPLRIGLNNTCGEFFKDLVFNTYLKLGTEPKLMEIFDRIKKEIKKMEQLIQNLHLSFNFLKVLSKEILLLKKPIYVQDAVIHFKTVAKTKNVYFSNVYLDKVLIIKNC